MQMAQSMPQGAMRDALKGFSVAMKLGGMRERKKMSPEYMSFGSEAPGVGMENVGGAITALEDVGNAVGEYFNFQEN